MEISVEKKANVNQVEKIQKNILLSFWKIMNTVYDLYLYFVWPIRYGMHFAGMHLNQHYKLKNFKGATKTNICSCYWHLGSD